MGHDLLRRRQWCFFTAALGFCIIALGLPPHSYRTRTTCPDGSRDKLSLPTPQHHSSTLGSVMIPPIFSKESRSVTWPPPVVWWHILTDCLRIRHPRQIALIAPSPFHVAP